MISDWDVSLQPPYETRLLLKYAIHLQHAVFSPVAHEEEWSAANFLKTSKNWGSPAASGDLSKRPDYISGIGLIIL